jgi:hypothetical protein
MIFHVNKKSKVSKLILEMLVKRTFGSAFCNVGEWIVPTQEAWFRIKELTRINKIQF